MPGYPGITTDYPKTFAALRNLPVDIFIGAHASYYDGMEKARKARAFDDRSTLPNRASAISSRASAGVSSRASAKPLAPDEPPRRPLSP
jgi:hypothetical protein